MHKRTLRQALLNSAAFVTSAGLSVAFAANNAIANPASASVTTGSASIASSATRTQIDQKSEDVVIDWSSFNIGTGRTAQFIQPNAQAIAINRIGGNAPSQILGTLDANGRIVLINGNGMLFGKGATVNVGSLTATSTGGSDSDLLSGKFTQAGSQSASIINHGNIQAAQGGLVAVVAPNVTNAGTVNAKFGTVALGAANKFTVDFSGDGLVSFAAQGDVNARATATNTGSLAGANVSLTARAAEGLATGVVNVSGTIIAQTARNVGGTIVLDAGEGGDIALSNGKLNASGAHGGGNIQIGGWNANSVEVDKASVLNASATLAGNGGTIGIIASNTNFAGQAFARGGAAGGDGGSIETSGHTLDFGGALIDAGAVHGRDGNWLLDPYDLTVSAAAATSIDGSLNSGTNVTLQTTATGTSGPGTSNASGNGDIFIDSPISWGTNATLTLSAYRNIDFNADVTVAGGGALSLMTGTGTSGDYLITAGNNISFTGGSSSGASLSINGTPYTLLYSMSAVQNINASNTALNGDYALASSLDASNMGWTPIGTIGESGVQNSGNGFAGIFAGLGNTIANLNYTLPGEWSYSGLFGYSSGAIRDVGLTGNGGNNDGGTYAGGIAGYNSGAISNVYDTGAVSGYQFVGGLVGENSGGTIKNSYSTGAVIGSLLVGGLVGYEISNGAIANSFATGPVQGSANTGGLVGYISSGTISNSYALGVVINGSSGAGGGLVGEADGATITDSFATGLVYTYVGGGLVGYSSTPSTVTNSYWDSQTAEVTSSVGGTAMTTAQLQGVLPAGFASSVWGTGSGLFPYLLSQYPNGTPQSVSGFAYFGLGGAPSSLATVSLLDNGVSYGTASAGANGYYYALLAPGAISNGQLLAYVAGSKGGAIVQNASGSQSELDIYGGYLSFATASTSYASATEDLAASLATAIGGNSTAQSAVNGTALAIITSGSSFTIDTPVTMSQGLLIDATATGANIVIADPVTLTGNNKLTLEAGGTITQNNSDTITAAAFGGSSSGAVTLNANNDIGTIENISTGNGSFSLTNAAGLSIAGALNAGTGNVTLRVKGTITGESNSVVTAMTLTGTSMGAASLPGSNKITNLDAFTTSNGAFDLVDASPLTVTGAINAGSGNLTVGSGGGLTLNAPLTGSTVYVWSNGAIGGNNSGVITAQTLVGYSGTTTSLLANNVFADLGAFATGAGKSGIDDLTSLTIVGAINTGTGSIDVNVEGASNNILVDAALSGYIVDLTSAGSITVNHAINIVYPSAGLGLFADGAVNIDAPITVSNEQGGVVLQTGNDTTTSPGKSIAELNFGLLGNISFANVGTAVGALEINGVQYTVITSLAEVQQYVGATGALSGDYALGASVDGTGVSGWVPVGTNGSGTIENSGQGFSGIFEGLGNTISNLTVSTGSNSYAGLFGYSTGTIRDLTITGGSVTGGKYVGGLVGYQSGGVISNVVAYVPVIGATDVGGIAGENTGAITQSSAASTVSGTIGGGLVGMNTGALIEDFAVGAVNVSSQGGGLVGSNSGTIKDDYSTASVADSTGGLIGTNTGGTVSDSYWDTQTSGASSSAAGSGLSTAQMQDTLPAGFGSPVWGTGVGVFPYLLQQYPNGAPVMVSGTAYTSESGSAAAGEPLTLMENGRILAEFDSGANGGFSTLLAPGANAVIIAAGTGGASLVENVSAPESGVSIYGNTLNEVTSDSLESALNESLAEALGLADTQNNVLGDLNILRIDTSAPTFTIGMNWPGTVDLIAAGSVSGSGTAGTFMGSSNGPVTLSYLTVNNLGPFTTNNGSLSLSMTSGSQAGSTNAISGAIDTGTGNLTITDSTSELYIDAPVTGGAFTLNVYGAIAQNSAGVISAASLTGAAGGGDPSESATLTANNAIGSLGAFIAESGFSFYDTVPLTITGPINAGTSNLTLTTVGVGNGLTINGTLTGGTVDLASGGSLTQGSMGAITASTLTGSSDGAISLIANNAVATLGAFATDGGSLAFTDAQALTVNTAYNMGAANLTLATTGVGNNLTIDAPLAGATVDLTSGGTITQNNAGTITATTLMGSSNGAVTLTAANDVADLGSFATTNGALSLTTAESLAIIGPIGTGAGNVSLVTTGPGSNIVVDGALTDSGTATLTSAGTISEGSGGVITAATLTGSANGAVTLTGNNAVTNLGAISTNGGSLSFTDAKSLTVNTAFNMGTANLTLSTSGAGNNLTIDAALSGTTVDLVSSGTINQNSAGVITTTTLTGSSTNGTILNDANLITDLGAFTNSGAGGFALTDGKTLTVDGALGAGSGGLSLTTTGAGSNIVIDAAITDGATATLSSDGTIAEGSGGAVTAAKLSGSAAGATTLNGANDIVSLGAFANTGGNFSLTDDEGLTVAGTVSAGADTVTLNDDGVLMENSAGAIVAHALVGSSSGGTTLNGANDIFDLETFTNSGAGGFALTNDGVLNVYGAVNAGTGNFTVTTAGTGSNLAIDRAVTAGGTVSLVSAGTIAEGTEGLITAAEFTGSAVGSTALNAANQIGSLGVFRTTGGNFALTDSQNLELTDLINAGTNAVTLNIAGTLGESGAGAIDAKTLSGTSTGGAALTGANRLADLGAFTNTGGGGLAFADAQTLTVNGAVNAGTGDLSLTTDGKSGNIVINSAVADGGTITLTSIGAISEGSKGSMSAASLASSGTKATTLNGANEIATLAGLSTTDGKISLTDNETLTVDGPVNAGKRSLTLQTTNGDLVIAGALDGEIVTLGSTAGEVYGTGAVTATLLNVTADTGIDLTGPNAIKKLGKNQTNSGPDIIDGVK